MNTKTRGFRSCFVDLFEHTYFMDVMMVILTRQEETSC